MQEFSKLLLAVPGLLLALILVVAALLEYRTGYALADDKKLHGPLIYLAVWGIYFYVGLIVLLVLKLFLSGLSAGNVLFVFSSMIATVMTILALVLPKGGSVFNWKAGDLLELPAIMLVSMPGRFAEGPKAREFRDRTERRQKIVERIRQKELSSELAEVSLELINPLPLTNERSLLVDAVSYRNVEVAQAWLDRGASVEPFLADSGRPHPLSIAIARGFDSIAERVYAMSTDMAQTADELFRFGTLRCQPQLVRFAVGKGARIDMPVLTGKTSLSTSRPALRQSLIGRSKLQTAIGPRKTRPLIP